MVAAGTGSIGEALLADGAHVSIGGWGYPVGDAKAAAPWIGIARHAACATSRGPEYRRAGRSRKRSTASRAARGMRCFSWCERAGQNAYAALAPLVFETERSDPFSAELLSSAARSRRHRDDTGSRGRLAARRVGSIGVRLHPRLDPRVRARLVEPHGDAIDGALQLIRRELDAR